MKATLWALGALVAGSASAKFCRCQSDQPCWPSEDNWARLNSSTDGNLVKVKPFASSCHDPLFNAAECTVAQENTHSSTYRSSDPGALQWSNWEAWPEKNEQCYIETSQDTPCKQGRISLFSVKAQEAKHVQEAVRFAGKHNLKLVIKNSGHDFMGRSAAPHSLQIFTHEMKEMTIVDNFVLTVPGGKQAPAGIKAVTLGAGVQLHEMYSYLGARGVMVVGGTANTVGISGGYTQGGGHSLLGWLHGMASDNVLEFRVILANGSLIVANDYQNSDVFFALRGGGGGSFGVVVSATIKAHPDYPTVVARMNYTTPVGASYWDGVGALQKHILNLNDNGGSGFYGLIPNTPLSDNQTVSMMILAVTFVNQTDTKVIEDIMAPLKSDIESAIGAEPFYNVTALPSLSTYYLSTLQGSDTTGLQMRLASRLTSRELFESGNHTKLTKAISTIQYGPGDGVVGAIVAGGQVSENRDIESGLNPAWRDTLVHLIIAHYMSPEWTFTQQRAFEANITNEEVPLLRSLEPGKMGAYMNEADADETDFQQSFWGTNYPRLQAIKKSRDPHDLFIVRKGVGSENWDDSGLCRA